MENSREPAEIIVTTGPFRCAPLSFFDKLLGQSCLWLCAFMVVLVETADINGYPQVFRRLPKLRYVYNIGIFRVTNLLQILHRYL